jgi:predicted transposase YdaD
MILSKHSETTSEIKVKPTPIQVDIRKTFLYKWGKEEGLKEGKQRGLVKGLKEAILRIVQLLFNQLQT